MRFFERVKIERRLYQLKKQTSRSAEEQAQLQQLQEDLKVKISYLPFSPCHIPVLQCLPDQHLNNRCFKCTIMPVIDCLDAVCPLLSKRGKVRVAAQGWVDCRRAEKARAGANSVKVCKPGKQYF